MCDDCKHKDICKWKRNIEVESIMLLDGNFLVARDQCGEDGETTPFKITCIRKETEEPKELSISLAEKDLNKDID